MILGLIFFVFGTIVGSFLNSVIHRFHTGESFLLKRSHCLYCKHILGWQDLIPVLSFIILKGRCRYCQQKISWQYPLVEIFTGIIFFLTILNDGNIYAYAYFLLLDCFLIVIFVYDLKHYIIPDKVIYPAIAITLLYQLFRIWDLGHWDLFRISNLGFGILPSLFFLAIILFSGGRWMGMGDFKLAFLMGLLLGFPNILVALFLAFLIGAGVGLILIALGKKTLKSEVPFGPFLVTGTFIAMFFGQNLVHWYSHLFLIR